MGEHKALVTATIVVPIDYLETEFETYTATYTLLVVVEEEAAPFVPTWDLDIINVKGKVSVAYDLPPVFGEDGITILPISVSLDATT